MSDPLRFSVVVPTSGRAGLVVRLVRALERQESKSFETIVVVDGGGDGAAEALRALAMPFRLTVLEQPKAGAAAARNAGAASAAGEILLFLDDDMIPHPRLLAEHDRSHRDGADLVLGHIPLDPESPATPVAAAVGRWAERRRARLASTPADLPVPDLISGQMSVSRAAFARLGGFDVAFRRGGLVPGADRDFGYRARRAGLRIVFNPDAISEQYYEIDAREYTRRSFDGMRGDRILEARYPELSTELWRPRFDGVVARIVLTPLVFAPRALSAPLRELAIRLFSTSESRLANRLFFAVQTMERLRGSRAGRRATRVPTAAVLAYHSLSDLDGDPLLRPYGVEPERFAAQLDELAAAGWTFVGLDELLEIVEGRARTPSPRTLLVTFDDAYADLAAAAPILVDRGVPAVVFAVTDALGGTNTWRRTGATELRLLDAGGLLELTRSGLEVGSHGATHKPLPSIPAEELEGEVAGSAAGLEAAGLPRPRAFSYPHGEWTPVVAGAVAAAGYRAAFTVAGDVVRAYASPHSLPRVEVTADDSPQGLVRKLERLLTSGGRQ